MALALYGETERGMGRLKSLLGDDQRSNRRVIAVQAVGQLARAGVEADACLAALVEALADPAAFVRRAACETLGELSVESAIDPLVACLRDPEKVVQSAASAALRSMGRAATEKILPVLLEPVSGRIGATPDEAARLDAALDALDPATPGLIEALFEYVDQEVARLHALRELHAALEFEETKLDLVHQELALREDQAEARLVKSVGLFGDREAMSLVSEALHSDDPQLRASSVETLETLGSRELVKRILPHLEEAEEARYIDARGKALTPTAAVERLLVDGDHWLMALAAYAVAEMDLSDLSGRLDAMKANPDPLVAEAAQGALQRMAKEGDMTREMTRTVSALERTILLKQVPLFEGLDLDDLKQIADIAREQWHDDQAIIYHEGDQGDEMMLVIEGKVRIYTQSGEEKVTLATPGEGEVVGEMALLDSAPRSASVEAMGRLHVLIIEREPFLAILHERPEVSLKLMRSLTRRLREMIAAGTG